MTLSLQTHHLSRFNLHHRMTKPRYQSAKSFEFVGGRYQADHTQLELRYRLLELQILVCGYEDIEICRRQTKKLAVLLAPPPLLRNRANLVIGEIAGQLDIDALVKQHASSQVELPSLRPMRPKLAVA